MPPGASPRSFFALLPRSTRIARELAHEHDTKVDGRTWLEEEGIDRPVEHVLEVRSREFADNHQYVNLLRDHRIGLVVADTAGRWPCLDAITSPVVYARLHGDTELYVSGYTEQALAVWADRVRRWREQADVYVYFDNDVKVHAPFDAQRLADLLEVGPAG